MNEHVMVWAETYEISYVVLFGVFVYMMDIHKKVKSADSAFSY
jgi:hypothetical protein